MFSPCSPLRRRALLTAAGLAVTSLAALGPALDAAARTGARPADHGGAAGPTGRTAAAASPPPHRPAAWSGSHRAAGRSHAASRGHARPALTWSRARAHRVLALVRRERGKPYVFGAAGPRAFDCSGLVQWVYRHALGTHLPRNTNWQWRAVRHISRRHLRPGDLVFVKHGRWVEHVGIYAGHGTWWEAPHTGSHVMHRRIWSHHVVYGRVTR